MCGCSDRAELRRAMMHRADGGGELRTSSGAVAYTNATQEDWVMSDAPARDRTDEDQDADQVDPEATDPATDPVEDDQAVETTEEIRTSTRRPVEDEDEAKDRGKA